jgi:CrcB protein
VAGEHRWLCGHWRPGWVVRFRVGIGQHWQLFLVTGILGGFTTFSAFSLDTVLLYERGQIGMAIGYVVTSVGCSVCATVLALSVVRALE